MIVSIEWIFENKLLFNLVAVQDTQGFKLKRLKACDN